MDSSAKSGLNQHLLSRKRTYKLAQVNGVSLRTYQEIITDGAIGDERLLGDVVDKITELYARNILVILSVDGNRSLLGSI